MWLVDTGCGYDIVSKREVSKLKRFISKATCGITFHTANGATRTEDVANIYVKELDENITLHIPDNTTPALTVGCRCLEMGYTCVWPAGQNPYFHKTSWQFSIAGCRALHSVWHSELEVLQAPQAYWIADLFRSAWRGATCGATERRGGDQHRRKKAAPSDVERPATDDEVAQAPSGDDEIERLPPSSRLSLQEEATSLYHLLTHKPTNPYYGSCKRAKWLRR